MCSWFSECFLKQHFSLSLFFSFQDLLDTGSSISTLDVKKWSKISALVVYLLKRNQKGGKVSVSWGCCSVIAQPESSGCCLLHWTDTPLLQLSLKQLKDLVDQGYSLMFKRRHKRLHNAILSHKTLDKGIQALFCWRTGCRWSHLQASQIGVDNARMTKLFTCWHKYKRQRKYSDYCSH